MTDAPEQTKFAYWVPNVSGGLVTSTIEQRTDWGYDYNRELAVLAENNGFDYALSQVRYMASYGAEYQHESTSFSLALLLATERLKVIAAVHPGLWHPGVLAKLGRHRRPPLQRPLRGERRLAAGSRTSSPPSASRGSSTTSATAAPRSSSRALRGIWTEDHADLARRLLPVPRLLPEAQAADIRDGRTRRSSRAATPAPRAPWPAGSPTGTSPTARTSTASSSRSPTSARPPAEVGAQRPEVRPQRLPHRPRHRGRGPRHAPRDRRQGAPRGRRGLRRRRPAGRAVHQDGKGMWADSSFEDLVQYNDGFRTQLIGTPEQIAERIVEYKKHRRQPVPHRLPALPGGSRALRPGRPADRPRARGAGGPGRADCGAVRRARSASTRST